jgi:hypothetical protein
MPQLTDPECDAIIQEIDDETLDLGGAADRAIVRCAYRIAIKRAAKVCRKLQRAPEMEDESDPEYLEGWNAAAAECGTAIRALID